VRLVRHDGAPLDTRAVLDRLLRVAPRRGATPWATVRRDLSALERTTAGVPRVGVLHRRRAAFYPGDLQEDEVVERTRS